MLYRLIFVLGLVIAPLPIAQGNPPTASVDVTVTIVDASNNAVSDVPLLLLTHLRSRGFGYTDAAGKLTVSDLEIADADGKRWVWVIVSDGQQIPHVVADQALSLSRFQNIAQQFVLPVSWPIEVAANQDTVEVQIELFPGHAVTGRITDQAGDPIEALVILDGADVDPVLSDDETGDFLLPRVDVSKPFNLVIATGDQSSVVVHVVDLSGSAAPYDLGDIVFVCPEENASVSIEIPVVDEIVYDLPSPVYLNGSVTLIHETGDYAYVFYINLETRRAVPIDRPVSHAEFVPVAAGKYYIVPGGPSTSLAKVVVGALISGDSAGLDQHDVPSINVQAGMEAQATVEIRSAQEKIETYGSE